MFPLWLCLIPPFNPYPILSPVYPQSWAKIRHYRELRSRDLLETCKNQTRTSFAGYDSSWRLKCFRESCSSRVVDAIIFSSKYWAYLKSYSRRLRAWNRKVFASTWNRSIIHFVLINAGCEVGCCPRLDKKICFLPKFSRTHGQALTDCEWLRRPIAGCCHCSICFPSLFGPKDMSLKFGMDFVKIKPIEDKPQFQEG